MKPKSILVIGLLVVSAVAFYPRVAPFVDDYLQKKPEVKKTEVTVTPSPALQPAAAPLLTALQGQPAIAKDFSIFYLNLRDSLARDTNSIVYPTTERFLKVHSTALISCYQSRPDYQKFGIGATIDKVIETSMGGLESKPITQAERTQLIAALDTIIYTLLQVK